MSWIFWCPKIPQYPRCPSCPRVPDVLLAPSSLLGARSFFPAGSAPSHPRGWEQLLPPLLQLHLLAVHLHQGGGIGGGAGGGGGGGGGIGGIGGGRRREHLLGAWCGSNEGEEDGQGEESVEETEEADEEEYLEEGEEDVGLGGVEEGEGEQGGGAAVEHRGSDFGHRGHHALVPGGGW